MLLTTFPNCDLSTNPPKLNNVVFLTGLTYQITKAPQKTRSHKYKVVMPVAPHVRRASVWVKKTESSLKPNLER